MNQDKGDILKQQRECLNITVLFVSKLKWTGMGAFLISITHERTNSNKVALIWRQDVAQVVKGYHERLDPIIYQPVSRKTC